MADRLVPTGVSANPIRVQPAGRPRGGGAQEAIRATKCALNQWYRQNSAIFDVSLGFELLGLGGHDVVEGVASHHARRKPDFGSDRQ